VLFTVPGVPCVYYGDELAWRGVKEDRAGGDDAVRPPLPATGYPQDAEQAALLDLHRRLVALRRERPELTRAVIDVVDIANRRLTYTVTADGSPVFVTIDVDVDDPAPPPGWDVLLSGPRFSIAARS
jgi:cyclomaltodextrinase